MSTEPVIEVAGLRKEYRRFRKGRAIAVDGLDLVVPRGGVYGFLGPNGSGKTTTIRCLLGLVRPSAGTCRILGVDATDSQQLARVITRIGSIVETPTFFPNFSGRRNLELLARIQGIGRTAVAASIERVGLADRADDPVKGYSLGMKQRLGIAGALVRDPELLILDEPANGLDPAGIREIRELVRQLGSEGRTVFVSSHLLHEIEQTCDTVAILRRGRLVTAGSVKDVLASKRAGAMLVRVEHLDAGADALRAAGAPVARLDGCLRVEVAPEHGAWITSTLAAAGQWVSELKPDEVSFEDLFLELTSDDPAVAGAAGNAGVGAGADGGAAWVNQGVAR